MLRDFWCGCWHWFETFAKDCRDIIETVDLTKERTDFAYTSLTCKAWWGDEDLQKPMHSQRKYLAERGGDFAKCRDFSALRGGVQRIVRPTHSKDDTHKSRCNSCVTFHLPDMKPCSGWLHVRPFRHKKMSAFPREPAQKRTCEIFRCIKFIPICVLQRATINVDDHFVLTSAQIDVTSWTKELQIKHGKTWSGSFMMTFKQSTAVLAYVILFLCLGSELWFSSAGALPRAAQPLFCSQTLVWFNFFASIVYGIWRGNGCNGYSDFCLRNVILLHFFCFGPCCKHLALVRQMFSLCLNFCFQNGVTTFECRGTHGKTPVIVAARVVVSSSRRKIVAWSNRCFGFEHPDARHPQNRPTKFPSEFELKLIPILDLLLKNLGTALRAADANEVSEPEPSEFQGRWFRISYPKMGNGFVFCFWDSFHHRALRNCMKRETGCLFSFASLYCIEFCRGRRIITHIYMNHFLMLSFLHNSKFGTFNGYSN